MTRIPCYYCPATKRTVQFFPVADRVLRRSATHRVVIDGRACDWLSAGYRPSAQTARFFLEKHAAPAA